MVSNLHRNRMSEFPHGCTHIANWEGCVSTELLSRTLVSILSLDSPYLNPGLTSKLPNFVDPIVRCGTRPVDSCDRVDGRGRVTTCVPLWCRGRFESFVSCAQLKIQSSSCPLSLTTPRRPSALRTVLTGMRWMMAVEKLKLECSSQLMSQPLSRIGFPPLPSSRSPLSMAS